MTYRDVNPSPQAKEERVTATVLRGVRRLLGAMGYSTVCELSLPNGRRADVAAISGSGQILIVEIKSSAADFRSDQKWPEYRDYCDQLYFAVAPDGPIELIPSDTGLIVADSYFGELVRSAPTATIIAARRRAVLLAFACHAADRLHAIQDPQANERFR